MVVALVIFIICSFVALAIVNSAILNAKRTIAERKGDIAFKATTQAMKLITDCIKDDSIYRYEEGVSANDDNNTVKGMEETFGLKIKEMAETVASSNDETSRTITFESEGLDGLDGTLKGKITMQSDFTINVDVWIDGGKEDYPLTLTIPGSSQTVLEDKIGKKIKPEVNAAVATGTFEQKEVTYISWSKIGMYVTGKKASS